MIWGAMPQRKEIMKKYTVYLDEFQMDFLKKLAKHDSISVHTEVQSLLDLQIRETKEVMENDYPEEFCEV